MVMILGADTRRRISHAHDAVRGGAGREIARGVWGAGARTARRAVAGSASEFLLYDSFTSLRPTKQARPHVCTSFHNTRQKPGGGRVGQAAHLPSRSHAHAQIGGCTLAISGAQGPTSAEVRTGGAARGVGSREGGVGSKSKPGAARSSRVCGWRGPSRKQPACGHVRTDPRFSKYLAYPNSPVKN